MTLIKLPASRSLTQVFSQFTRSSWMTLVIATVILIYIFFPAVLTYLIPSDGWILDASVNNGDAANATLFFKTQLVNRPTPIQASDVLLAIDNHPVKELLSRWTSFAPLRPDSWISGGIVNYTILRAGKTIDVTVTLAPLPIQALFRTILASQNNLWLVIFMYAFFLPVMAAIGILVFLRRPRHLAAQALLLISITFIGQVSYAPFDTACLFYWPLSIPYGFLLNRWTSILIPTALLLSLAFPSPKGLLRRRLGISLALIYLPWVIGDWVIPILRSGDLTGLYATWIQFSLVEMALIPVMVGALIHSFRTVHETIERAQLKWFSFGFIGFIVAGGISWLIGSVFNLPAFNSLVNYFGYLFLPFCLGIAILRYHLFDIDLIIRRTLLYTALTATLGLVFYGGVTLLQRLFTAFAGQQSPASIVISTLLIAALFSPVRRRLQGFIDRRFYRQRYNAGQALIQFGGGLRERVEVSSLTDHLVTTIEDMLRPEHMSLWLRKDR